MKFPFRQHLTCLVAFLLIAAGVVAGLTLPIPRPSWHPRDSATITHGWSDLWIIAGRNLRIGLQLLLGAFSLGAYSLFQLFIIGLTLGLVISGARSAGVSWAQLALLLGPHTPVEFAGFAALGALEFEAAALVYRKLRYDRTEFDHLSLRQLIRRAFIGFALIVAAAVVEVFVTGPLAKYVAPVGGH